MKSTESAFPEKEQKAGYDRYLEIREGMRDESLGVERASGTFCYKDGSGHLCVTGKNGELGFTVGFRFHNWKLIQVDVSSAGFGPLMAPAWLGNASEPGVVFTNRADAVESEIKNYILRVAEPIGAGSFFQSNLR